MISRYTTHFKNNAETGKQLNEFAYL